MSVDKLKRLDLKTIPEFLRTPACGYAQGMLCEICDQPMAHLCEGLLTHGVHVVAHATEGQAVTLIRQCIMPHHLACHFKVRK